MARTVTLVEIDTPQLWSRVTAEMADDGTLSIEGQDIGASVEAFWGKGMNEYEWAYSITPAAVAALRAALGGGDDVLASLRERFSGDKYKDLSSFLDEHAISYGFWSRNGD